MASSTRVAKKTTLDIIIERLMVLSPSSRFWFLSIKLQKIFFAHIVADSNTQFKTYVNKKSKIPCSQLQGIFDRKLHLCTSNPNVLANLPMFGQRHAAHRILGFNSFRFPNVIYKLGATPEGAKSLKFPSGFQSSIENYSTLVNIHCLCVFTLCANLP
jgi:hypothetical protein